MHIKSFCYFLWDTSEFTLSALSCLIFWGVGCLVAWGTCVKFADVDLRCMSLLRWGRRAREFQKHCHQLKIPVKKRPKTVSFFIITGEMEKLYRQITETQRINQNMMIHGTVAADLRINTSKTHEHPAASISCFFFYLFTIRLVSERGSAQGPVCGRAGSKAALPLPVPAKFSPLSWDNCTIKTACCVFWRVH